MGLKAIAEFVENDVILSQVKKMGGNYAQGYRIAKPRPLKEIQESHVLIQADTLFEAKQQISILNKGNNMINL